MPYKIIEKDSAPTVICMQCKQPVERRQKRKGKAFCMECEENIFGEDAGTMQRTGAESFIDRKRMEQRMFEKMMGRMFRRLKM